MPSRNSSSVKRCYNSPSTDFIEFDISNPAKEVYE